MMGPYVAALCLFVCLSLSAVGTVGQSGNRVDNITRRIVWGDLPPDETGRSYQAGEYTASRAGLGGFFALGRGFVGASLGEILPTERLVDAVKGKASYHDAVGQMTPTLLGYFIAIAIGLLFFLVFPTIASVCVCVRGLRQQGNPNEKTMSTENLKFLLGAIAIAAIFIIVGAACGLSCTALAPSNVDNLHTPVRYSVEDAYSFVIKLEPPLRHLLGTNLFYLANVSGEQLLELPEIVTREVTEMLFGLFDLDEVLDNIKKNETSIRDNIMKINNLTRQADKERKETVSVMAMENARCRGCLDAEKTDLENLDFDAVSGFMNRINESLSVDVREEMRNDVNTKLRPDLEEKLQSINVTAEINKIFNSTIEPLFTALDKLQEKVYNQSREYGKKADEYINTAYGYQVIWKVVLIMLLCVPLVVGVLSVGGAFHVWKGATADDNNPTREERFKSGRVLLCAVVILILIFSIILMLPATLLYIVGAPVERFVCQKLSDPLKLEEQFGRVAEGLANINLKALPYKLSNHESKFSVSSFLLSCQGGKTLYAAINMEPVVKPTLDEVGRFKNTTVEPALNFDLGQLAATMAAMPLNAQTQVDSLVSVTGAAGGLNTLIAGIDRTVEGAYDNAKSQNLTGLVVIEHLERLKTTTAQIKLVAGELVTSANDVQANAKVIPGLLTAISAKLNDSQTTAKVLGRIVDEVRIPFLANVDSFLDHVLSELQTNVAQCHSLYAIYNALALEGLCSGVIDPLNGVWVGLGWTLFFFMVLLFLCLLVIKYLGRKEPEDMMPNQHPDASKEPSAWPPPNPYSEMPPEGYLQPQQPSLPRPPASPIPPSRPPPPPAYTKAAAANSDEFDLNYIYREI